ncbi:hypothetical protein NLX83_31825 [Allokutzneria sp. A3M-2-11 16]|uniref:hypothetical protein n=1 Tax=Allokutzneria sp. A3M-2-11 16 TaxID=2962043 RepID=UPI0020B67E56|nr:hypothetical protein [Allokutzneria sp. A3M-2-11 16]MCP3803868.1 hypothetical protein [Allokutzneria sp. A3M-2-11 16]
MRTAVLAVALVAVLVTASASAGGATRPVPVAPACPSCEALTPIDFKIVGKSTMAKLRSDLAMGPGEMRTLLDAKTGDVTGDLILPPSPGYFIVFGFTPATSTVDFIPEGRTVGKIVRGVLNTVSKVTIRLREVKVAGVPLDVGPNCRTATPVVIELTSGPSPPPFVPPRLLKPLYGTFTMPAFTGCGAKEPLDSLLTGLISGPGNAIRVELTHIPR